MHSVVNQPFSSSPLPINWKKEASVYTSDNVIEAYLKGKQDGKDEMTKILTRQFNDNLKIATDTSERLFQEAAKKKIGFKSIHLKADGITKFSAIFVTKMEDFVNDKFRDIFVTARNIKNDVESDSFYITFTFMPDSEHVNEKCIASDGYFLKYEKK